MNSSKTTNILLVIIGVLLALLVFVFFQSYQSSKEKQITVTPQDQLGYTVPVKEVYTEPKNSIPVASNIPITSSNTSSTAVSKPQPTSQSVSLDLSTELARTYKGILTKALKEKPNFNYHYNIVPIGCGTGCVGGIMIDLNTGKVFEVPFSIYSDYPEIRNVEMNIDSNVVNEYKIGFNEQKTFIKSYTFDPKLGWSSN